MILIEKLVGCAFALFCAFVCVDCDFSAFVCVWLKLKGVVCLRGAMHLSPCGASGAVSVFGADYCP